jgi:hypothetical protein
VTQYTGIVCVATLEAARLENVGEKFDHAPSQAILLLFDLLLHGVVRVGKRLQRIPFQFQFGSFRGCGLQIRAGIVRDPLAHGRELGRTGSLEFLHGRHQFILRPISDVCRFARARRSEGFVLPVRPVLVEAHADRRDSFRQPAMLGTLEPLWEFHGAWHRLRDERRVAFWTGHKIFGDLRGEMNVAERVGFEPTVGFLLHTLSKRAP